MSLILFPCLSSLRSFIQRAAEGHTIIPLFVPSFHPFFRIHFYFFFSDVYKKNHSSPSLALNFMHFILRLFITRRFFFFISLSLHRSELCLPFLVPSCSVKMKGLKDLFPPAWLLSFIYYFPILSFPPFLIHCHLSFLRPFLLCIQPHPSCLTLHFTFLRFLFRLFFSPFPFLYLVLHRPLLSPLRTFIPLLYLSLSSVHLFFCFLFPFFYIVLFFLFSFSP